MSSKLASIIERYQSGKMDSADVAQVMALVPEMEAEIERLTRDAKAYRVDRDRFAAALAWIEDHEPDGIPAVARALSAMNPTVDTEGADAAVFTICDTLRDWERCENTCPHGDRCTLPVEHPDGCNHHGCDCNEPDSDPADERAAGLAIEVERLGELCIGRGAMLDVASALIETKRDEVARLKVIVATLTECHRGDAWTDRGLHEPHCRADEGWDD